MITNLHTAAVWSLQDASLDVGRYLFVKPRSTNCLTHCCHGLTTATDTSAITLLSGLYFSHCASRFYLFTVWFQILHLCSVGQHSLLLLATLPQPVFIDFTCLTLLCFSDQRCQCFNYSVIITLRHTLMKLMQFLTVDEQKFRLNWHCLYAVIVTILVIE